MSEYKRCPKCGNDKWPEDFDRSYCCECKLIWNRIYSRKWREKNDAAAYMREYRKRRKLEGRPIKDHTGTRSKDRDGLTIEEVYGIVGTG